MAEFVVFTFFFIKVKANASVLWCVLSIYFFFEWIVYPSRVNILIFLSNLNYHDLVYSLTFILFLCFFFFCLFSSFFSIISYYCWYLIWGCQTGKYIPMNDRAYMHVHDMRELGRYIHIPYPYDGGYGPYSHMPNPYLHQLDDRL